MAGLNPGAAAFTPGGAFAEVSVPPPTAATGVETGEGGCTVNGTGTAGSGNSPTNMSLNPSTDLGYDPTAAGWDGPGYYDAGAVPMMGQGMSMTPDGVMGPTGGYGPYFDPTGAAPSPMMYPPTQPTVGIFQPMSVRVGAAALPPNKAKSKSSATSTGTGGAGSGKKSNEPKRHDSSSSKNRSLLPHSLETTETFSVYSAGLSTVLGTPLRTLLAEAGKREQLTRQRIWSAIPTSFLDAMEPSLKGKLVAAAEGAMANGVGFTPEETTAFCRLLGAVSLLHVDFLSRDSSPCVREVLGPNTLRNGSPAVHLPPTGLALHEIAHSLSKCFPCLLTMLAVLWMGEDRAAGEEAKEKIPSSASPPPDRGHCETDGNEEGAESQWERDTEEFFERFRTQYLTATFCGPFLLSFLSLPSTELWLSAEDAKAAHSSPGETESHSGSRPNEASSRLSGRRISTLWGKRYRALCESIQWNPPDLAGEPLFDDALCEEYPLMALYPLSWPLAAPGLYYGALLKQITPSCSTGSGASEEHSNTFFDVFLQMQHNVNRFDSVSANAPFLPPTGPDESDRLSSERMQKYYLHSSAMRHLFAQQKATGLPTARPPLSSNAPPDQHQVPVNAEPVTEERGKVLHVVSDNASPPHVEVPIPIPIPIPVPPELLSGSLEELPPEARQEGTGEGEGEGETVPRSKWVIAELDRMEKDSLATKRQMLFFALSALSAFRFVQQGKDGTSKQERVLVCPVSRAAEFQAIGYALFALRALSEGQRGRYEEQLHMMVQCIAAAKSQANQTTGTGSEPRKGQQHTDTASGSVVPYRFTELFLTAAHLILSLLRTEPEGKGGEDEPTNAPRRYMAHEVCAQKQKRTQEKQNQVLGEIHQLLGNAQFVLTRQSMATNNAMDTAWQNTKSYGR